MRYGSYNCFCGSTVTAKICSTDAYAVMYDVSNDKSQAETILAFRLINGYVDHIDKNLIVPLGAQVMVPSNVVLNREYQFWLDKIEVTKGVGIKDIKWQFPDNKIRWGASVTHTPTVKGAIRVTITDNFDKKVVLFKNI
jgi:hypothetical protein